MAKPEVPLKSGDEYDVFTGWRHVIRWKQGQIRRIKRRYHKRVRKAIKERLRKEG